MIYIISWSGKTLLPSFILCYINIQPDWSLKYRWTILPDNKTHISWLAPGALLSSNLLPLHRCSWGVANKDQRLINVKPFFLRERSWVLLPELDSTAPPADNMHGSAEWQCQRSVGVPAQCGRLHWISGTFCRHFCQIWGEPKTVNCVI